MNNRRSVLPKWSVVVVATLTVVLLLASFILNNVVFRAEQTSSAVYIEPSTAHLALGQQQSFRILAVPNGELDILAAQFELNFESKQLRLLDFEQDTLWKVTHRSEEPGKLRVALLSPAAFRVSGGPLHLGTAKFETIATSSARLELGLRNLILAAVDLGEGATVYNAATSAQSSMVFVSDRRAVEESTVSADLNESGRIGSEPSNESEGTVATSQRILSQELVLLPHAALFLVKLRYSAKLRIEYGQTSALGGAIEELTAKNTHAVFIHGLTPNTNYYYQVTVVDSKFPGRIRSLLKNFTTPKSSVNEPNALKSDFVIFPSRSADQATAYVVLRDDEGNVVSNREPVLDLTHGGVVIGEISRVADVFQASLSPRGQGRQFGQVTASVSGKQIDKKSVLFDPSFGPKEQSAELFDALPKWDEQAVATLIGLVFALLISGLIFVRALRRN